MQEHCGIERRSWEKCREAGIPLLILDYDLSDPRIVTHEGMITQVEHFMENVMKAEGNHRETRRIVKERQSWKRILWRMRCRLDDREGGHHGRERDRGDLDRPERDRPGGDVPQRPRKGVQEVAASRATRSSRTSSGPGTGGTRSPSRTRTSPRSAAMPSARLLRTLKSRLSSISAART